LEIISLGSKWKKVIYNVDTDKNGKIDFHEWLIAAVDHKNYLTEENINKIF